jgi:uncharacterized protein VirK/YbjX
LILTALKIVYREELGRPQGTVYSAIIRLINGARILLFPRAVDQINSMNVVGKLKHPTRNHDPLYFLVYRHYISKRFTISQRVQVALDHHKYESRFYNSEYIRQAYRSGGILLWERSFDDLHFTIVLIATPDNRNEGKADVFGLSPYTTMLISRNQRSRTSFRDAFNKCFKQNTPQLFCLSAVCGIAMTNEFRTIFGIKHDAQIIYKETLDTGFRNSYTALWEKFNATEIDHQVFIAERPADPPSDRTGKR